jgi:hypothetical protein
MQKKISTTFWFTVAIAIVALLAYTEVGAEDDPKVFFNKFGNSEITVELDPNNKIKSVVDTQTKKPDYIEKIKVLICEDQNENGIKDPKEPCYKATFLTPWCLIYGNPTYYGHGGDAYRRRP